MHKMSCHLQSTTLDDKGDQRFMVQKFHRRSRTEL